ncbi:tetratricopeptide repeat protein [Sphingobacterium thalpophilum]|nr:tetratricopeptide repeat protein [Sphingobacterium thalpophilum]
MFKNIHKTKLFLTLSASIYFTQAVHAQRATTTIDRNETAYEINELYKQGKWEAGKKIADDVLRKNPEDSDMRMLVGKYYIHRKDYDRARYELVKSLKSAPANVESKHMLVTVETETQRYSSAICYVNELLEVNPYWKGLWRKKIELYRHMGNHVEADRLLKRISQIYPEDSELKKDREYMAEQRYLQVKKEGKLDQSIEAIKKMVDERPLQYWNYTPLIDSYIKAGDFANALVYTERAINQFPASDHFFQKKITILEREQRYAEILSLLDARIKKGQGNQALWKQQYRYFLTESARNARNNDPAALYGKLFAESPKNKEAFNYVFNDLLAKEQYEEALAVLKKHKSHVGSTKQNDMMELMVYKRMGNSSKVVTLTKDFFNKYPGDTELRESFVGISLQEARDNMQDSNVAEAILDWQEAIRYGDAAAIRVAKRGLFNAYMTSGRYKEAMSSLADLLAGDPDNPDLLLKKSDLFLKQGDYERAMDVYEQVLAKASPENRPYFVAGYGEMIAPIVRTMREEYRLPEARQLVKRWLVIDPASQEALLNMINISTMLKDQEAMYHYAQIAGEQHDDPVFKIKLAEAMNHQARQIPQSWKMLHEQVQKSPYHQPLVNTYLSTTELYAKQLLNEKNHEEALAVIDSGLVYKDNKDLRYMKGLAYEGLRKFDSAYYYQKFYEPSLIELDDFKAHLRALAQKSDQNYVAISHLRARFGDDNRITSISSFEYGRLQQGGSAYVGRIHYAGREEGKGIQGQLEWSRPWSTAFATRIDIALANKYFAKLAVNASGFYEWKPGWEAELGLGYRRFFSGQQLYNLSLGLTKDLEDFRLGAKWSNYLLDSEGERIYLYSLVAKGQYFMNNRKNYLLATASIGSAPDADLLNNQLYNSFNVFNAMVGAGIGRSFSRHVSGSVIGTWYNFQTDGAANGNNYKNLYNLYVQLHVSF